MSREVVVTGMGMTTPVGGDVASNWTAILAGQSGIGVIDQDYIKYNLSHHLLKQIE